MYNMRVYPGEDFLAWVFYLEKGGSYEATSSIDTHTERMVQEGIAALLKDRTSFVIAHRLSTIQNADRIFVIDDGGIVESGSPKELMELKGAYYRLYMAQVV